MKRKFSHTVVIKKEEHSKMSVKPIYNYLIEVILAERIQTTVILTVPLAKLTVPLAILTVSLAQWFREGQTSEDTGWVLS